MMVYMHNMYYQGIPAIYIIIGRQWWTVIQEEVRLRQFYRYTRTAVTPRCPRNSGQSIE